MKYRYRVLLLLFILSMITFLDRVCLAVAGPRMQDELQISPKTFGWIVGIFSLASGRARYSPRSCSGGRCSRPPPGLFRASAYCWRCAFYSEPGKPARSRTARARFPDGFPRLSGLGLMASCGWRVG